MPITQTKPTSAIKNKSSKSLPH